MGLFSSSKKTDPAYSQSQAATQQIAQQMASAKLPDLPSIAAAAPPVVNVPANLPGYLGGGANTTYQPGLPNQLSMIANQLTAGGYGAPDMSMYKAQTVAPTPPPAPPPTPAAPAPAAAPAAPVQAAAPAPAAARPMGFTAQQQSAPRTSSSLSGNPMFNLPSDFLRYLSDPRAYTGSINRGGR